MVKAKYRHLCCIDVDSFFGCNKYSTPHLFIFSYFMTIHLIATFLKIYSFTVIPVLTSVHSYTFEQLFPPVMEEVILGASHRLIILSIRKS